MCPALRCPPPLLGGPTNAWGRVLRHQGKTAVAAQPARACRGRRRAPFGVGKAIACFKNSRRGCLCLPRGGACSWPPDRVYVRVGWGVGRSSFQHYPLASSGWRHQLDTSANSRNCVLPGTGWCQGGAVATHGAVGLTVSPERCLWARETRGAPYGSQSRRDKDITLTPVSLRRHLRKMLPGKEPASVRVYHRGDRVALFQSKQDRVTCCLNPVLGFLLHRHKASPPPWGPQSPGPPPLLSLSPLPSPSAAAILASCGYPMCWACTHRRTLARAVLAALNTHHWCVTSSERLPRLAHLKKHTLSRRPAVCP